MDILQQHGLIGGRKGTSDIDIENTFDVIAGQSIVKGDAVELIRTGANANKVRTSREYWQQYATAITASGKVADGMALKAYVGLEEDGEAVSVIAYQKTSTTIGFKAIRYSYDGMVQEGQEYLLNGWTFNTMSALSQAGTLTAVFVGLKSSFLAAAFIRVGSDLSLTFTETVAGISGTSMYYTTIIRISNEKFVLTHRNSSGYACAMAMYVNNSTGTAYFSTIYTVSSANTTYVWAKGVRYANGAVILWGTSGTMSTIVYASFSGTTSPSLGFSGMVHQNAVTIGTVTYGIVRSTVYPDEFWVVCKNGSFDIRLFKIKYSGGVFTFDTANAKLMHGVYGDGDALAIEVVNADDIANVDSGSSKSSCVIVAIYTATTTTYYLIDFVNAFSTPLEYKWNQIMPVSKVTITNAATIYSGYRVGNLESQRIISGTTPSGYDLMGGIRVTDAYTVSPHTSIKLVGLTLSRDLSTLVEGMVMIEQKPIGISTGNASGGEKVKVKMRGIVRGLSLVPGSRYYADKYGKLTREKTKNPIGIAISSSELLIRRSATEEGGMC
ncbi:hypothetical protein [Brevibacillus sp. 1238]|uniref:hypothetical protein n=1 Tax=Brevibacillus sp. 1238 TaxID=2940565 RepID=UPI00247307C4|nr:hypothetical protein [Brevibacillus sp. 1238]MDH6351942.1 hypothetical protein [Brevibacillus sp. 1238]